MRILTAAIALLALFAVACATTPGTATATPGSASVSLAAAKDGDSVRLTLTNGSGQPVAYNLCTSALYQRASADWRNVKTNHACTMELRTLGPGANDTFAYPLPASVARGQYQLRSSVEIAGTRREVASNRIALP